MNQDENNGIMPGDESTGIIRNDEAEQAVEQELEAAIEGVNEPTISPDENVLVEVAGENTVSDLANENKEDIDGSALPENSDVSEGDSAGVSDNDGLVLQPDFQPKSKKPLGVFLAIAAIAAVAVIAFIFLGQSPTKALAKAKKATSAEYQKVLENALFAHEREFIELTPQTDVDFTFTLKNISTTTGLPLFFLNGAELSGEINTNEDEKRLDAGFALNMSSENIFNLNLNLDDAFFSLNSPELLGDKYVSFDLSTINEDAAKNPISASLGLPQYDYAEAARQTFTFSEKINELNKAYATAAGGNGSIGSFMPETDVIAEADKNLEVKKGNAEEVEGIKCKTYETQYSVEVAQDIFNKYADSFMEGYEKSFNENLRMMEQTFPGLYDEVYSQIQNPTDELREVIGKVTFEKPIDAVYYVDSKNKIRRSVYSTAISFDEEMCDITIDTLNKGESNIYDSLVVKLTASADDGTIVFEMVSNGEHADKTVFTDISNIKATYSDKNSGTEEEFSIDIATNYDAALNETKLVLEFTTSSMPGKAMMGFTGRNETDLAAKTSKTVYDDIYIEFPGLSASFSMSCDIAPASGSPKSRADLKSSELLKMDALELDELYSEVSMNYELLMQRVFGLFGF